MNRTAFSIQWLLTTREGVKSLLVYGSYVFTILAGLVAVWAFVFPNSFGEALGKLTAMNEQLVESSKEIESNTAGSKREVSEDPIIQLTNRGYRLDTDEFRRALRVADLESIRLFCQTGAYGVAGGHRLFYRIPYESKKSPYSSSALEALAKCDKRYLEAPCKGVPGSSMDFLWKDAFVSACGNAAFERLSEQE